MSEIIGLAGNLDQPRRTAIQLARLSGFNPIITTASKRNEAYCRAAGATHVIDYKEVPYSELPATVAKIVGKPVPVSFDAISFGPETQDAAFAATGPKGDVIYVRPSAREAMVELEDGKRIASVYGATEDRAFEARLFAALSDYLKTGDIKVSHTFSTLLYQLIDVQ